MTETLDTFVPRFASARVLCVGDVMLDCFIDGVIRRISPESPVPVFTANSRRVFPGGAANVARNIFSLGGQCTLIGVIGQDVAGRDLVEGLAASGIGLALLPCAERPTTEKTRFVAQGQHVLRVDTEVVAPVPTSFAKDLVRQVALSIDAHDVLVLSDYGKGLLTEEVTTAVITLARTAGKPVIVDPKSEDLGKYTGATILTPNAIEMEAASGLSIISDQAAAAAGHLCLETTDIQAVLITRGHDGMTLASRDAPPLHIRSAVREVYDVVGAGDTVVATLALAVASGTSHDIAARLANVAAGIAVGKRGTSVVSPDELMMELRRASPRSAHRGMPAILTLAEVARYAEARRGEGKTVGFTNGVFDILHPGHISMLQFSRSACDCLIVGLNSDASVRRLKGPERPINPEADRAIVLGALGVVDVVALFETDTPLDLIHAIMPDVLIKGADYSLNTIVGADFVMSYGGSVLLAELVPGVSSSNTIAKAKATCR